MEIIRSIRNIIDNDLEVVDITFNRESSGRVLRILLDGDNLTLDRIAEVSRKVSSYLDEHESDIPYNNYSLEVSSVGLDRPLKKSEDFSKNIGKLCMVATKNKEIDGRRRYTGVIKSVSDKAIELFIEEEGKSFTIELDNISKANIEFKF